MKLIINKGQLLGTPDQFARRAGYGHIRDHRTGHDSYVRRLGSYHYPRLHMYIDERGEQVAFNLHLDQKQASYEGHNMHSGEYDGEVVEAEIARLKSLIGEPKKTTHVNAPRTSAIKDGAELVDSIGGNRNYLDRKPKEKKPWWKIW